jgi:hypothetical protein
VYHALVNGGDPRAECERRKRARGKLATALDEQAGFLALGLPVLALVTLVSTVQLGCEGGATGCYLGDYQDCSCGDGAPGYTQCIAGTNGNRYGACDCKSASPWLPAVSTDGGPETGAGDVETDAPAPAKNGFLEPCDGDDSCESGLCFAFTQKGSLCTAPCQGPAECPMPSSGCSNKGVCKAP